MKSIGFKIGLSIEKPETLNAILANGSDDELKAFLSKNTYFSLLDFTGEDGNIEVFYDLFNRLFGKDKNK